MLVLVAVLLLVLVVLNHTMSKVTRWAKHELHQRSLDFGLWLGEGRVTHSAQSSTYSAWFVADLAFTAVLPLRAAELQGDRLLASALVLWWLCVRGTERTDIAA